MLCLLSASLRRPPKNLELRPFYATCVYVIFVPRMIVQYVSLAGRASNIGTSSLVSAACNASTGTCTNPCEDMVLTSTVYRGSKERLLPVIWSMDDDAASQAVNWGAAGQWFVNATKVNNTTYKELIHYLWCAYLLVGPAYQCVQTISKGSPKEIRNKIFRRLQQDYRPRLQGGSRRNRLFLQLLIWTRYVWIFLGMASMDIRILQQVGRLIVWGGKRIYRIYMDEDPISFKELCVLEYNPCPRRQKLAKRVAVVWYLWSHIFIGFFPGFCVFITAKSEISIAGWVPQEHPFHVPFQWVPWVAAGTAAVGYTLRQLLFGVVSERALEEKKNSSNRRRIYIADGAVDDEGPEMIALLEKNIEDNNLSWPKHIMARIVLEWYDFKYWWRNPSAETRPKKDSDSWNWDETWRRGGGRGEIQNWTAFPNELPSYPTSSRYIPMAPDPKPTVEYSYDDEEETQKLLYEREGRRRKRGQCE